jgi:hypothetical protein
MPAGALLYRGLCILPYSRRRCGPGGIRIKSRFNPSHQQDVAYFSVTKLESSAYLDNQVDHQSLPLRRNIPQMREFQQSRLAVFILGSLESQEYGLMLSGL